MPHTMKSAHAVLYWYFKIPFISASIIPHGNDNSNNGRITTQFHFSPEESKLPDSIVDRRMWIKVGIQILYGGYIATIRHELIKDGHGSEKLITLSSTDTCKNSDMYKIQELGKIYAKNFPHCYPQHIELWTDIELNDFLNNLMKKTDFLVSGLWPEIEIIAAALIERKTLTEQEVKEIISCKNFQSRKD